MSWKPGDRRESHDAMVRVDQAGEYGATRIYAGQLAVMGDRTPTARTIAGMANQEEHHRAFFDAMIAKRGVRPTLIQPLWDVAGFALGMVTAAMGPRAAMACTAAIETEIDLHYAAQLAQLGIPIRNCATPSRASAMRRSSIAIPRSPRARKRRRAIRCCQPSSAPGVAWRSRCRSGSESSG